LPTDHLTAGLALPRISLTATGDSDVCLATLPGRSVIAVYPWTGVPGQPNRPRWDDIPGAHGSTPELEGFRDAADGFTHCGVTLFGLSGQDRDYQQELAERLALNFQLLSDVDGRFATALALPKFTSGEESYLKRLTLVVGDGCIEKLFYPVLDPGAHAAEVLGFLTKFQSPSASSSASSTE
jgi:peroxiredoxin